MLFNLKGHDYTARSFLRYVMLVRMTFFRNKGIYIAIKIIDVESCLKFGFPVTECAF